MPMQRVGRDNPVSKHEFHLRLLTWLSETDDDRVGDPDAHNRTKWVYVSDNGPLYAMHADTKRRGVLKYLQFVCEYGAGIEWIIIETDGGSLAVTPRAAGDKIAGFYFYEISGSGNAAQ